MDRSHLNQKHMKMQICKSLFTKGVQNVTICTDTYLETLFSLVIAVSIMSCRKSDHTAIKRSFSSLRTVNEQKVKCWYFA